MHVNTRSINSTRRERRRDQLTHLEVREEALMEKKVDLDWLAMHFPAVSKTTTTAILHYSKQHGLYNSSCSGLSCLERNYCLIPLSATVQSFLRSKALSNPTCSHVSFNSTIEILSHICPFFYDYNSFFQLISCLFPFNTVCVACESSK